MYLKIETSQKMNKTASNLFQKYSFIDGVPFAINPVFLIGNEVRTIFFLIQIYDSSVFDHGKCVLFSIAENQLEKIFELLQNRSKNIFFD